MAALSVSSCRLEDASSCITGASKCEKDGEYSYVFICREDGEGFDKLGRCAACDKKGKNCLDYSCPTNGETNCQKTDQDLYIEFSCINHSWIPSSKMCSECSEDGKTCKDPFVNYNCPTGNSCTSVLNKESDTYQTVSFWCDDDGKLKMMNCAEGQFCFEGQCSDMQCKDSECTNNDSGVGEFKKCKSDGKFEERQECAGGASCKSDFLCGECKNGDVKCENIEGVGVMSVCQFGMWVAGESCQYQASCKDDKSCNVCKDGLKRCEDRDGQGYIQICEQKDWKDDKACKDESSETKLLCDKEKEAECGTIYCDSNGWAQGVKIDGSLVQNAYCISSEADLIKMRDAINSGTPFPSADKVAETYVLTNDIIIKEFPWVPIGIGGSDGHDFEANFYGYNHKISFENDVVADGKKYYRVGLFGVFGSEKQKPFISNLRIEGTIRIKDIIDKEKSENTDGAQNVGLLAGLIYNSKIQNVDYSVIINDDTLLQNIKEKYQYVGGLFGFARNSEVEYVNTFGKNQIVTSNAYTGGLTGDSYRTNISSSNIHFEKIESSWNYPDDKTYGAFGGLVGNSNDSKITNNFIYVNKLSSSGNGHANVGGIVGYTWQYLEIINCISYTNINGLGRKGGFVGGIIYNNAQYGNKTVYGKPETKISNGIHFGTLGTSILNYPFFSGAKINNFYHLDSTGNASVIGNYGAGGVTGTNVYTYLNKPKIYSGQYTLKQYGSFEFDSSGCPIATYKATSNDTEESKATLLSQLNSDNSFECAECTIDGTKYYLPMVKDIYPDSLCTKADESKCNCVIP